jgi:hypothetical protein
MLIYSMSVSVDGFIADREGAFEWTAPSEELCQALGRVVVGGLVGRGSAPVVVDDLDDVPVRVDPPTSLRL